MQISNERGQRDMKKRTLGMMIASLRKENGMTQLELAEKMGVTDKAVQNGSEIYPARILTPFPSWQNC